MPTLDFKGKQHIYAHHLTVPYRPLVPDAAKSVAAPADGDGASASAAADDNLIIHGDNLHALKALLPRYAGKVKCIYIDPPYNTGNEGWVYNDKVNSPLMREWLKQNGPVDGEDLERHDKWLCMMWPRLHLLKELLSDDGVIFVSIDDNEQHHLRMLMDEVFGGENFIVPIVWKKRSGAPNDRRIGAIHENILLYCRSGQSDDVLNRRQRGKAQIGRYKNPDNHPKGVWAPDNLMANVKGGRYVESLYFPITNPATGEVHYPSSNGNWRFNQDTIQTLLENDEIYFGTNGKGRPKLKRFLCDVKEGIPYGTIWDDVPQGTSGSREIQDLLGNINLFDTPKPEGLVRQIIEMSTGPNDIILDSFAGSGTTAHAVLALNQADGGHRKFILVECEDYADTITAERVRRVINGVPGAREPSLRDGLGGSFTYCTLGAPIDAEGMLTGESLPAYTQLAAWLLHTATGISAAPGELPPQNDAGLFYTADGTDYYLLYRPDLKWLRSNAAIFTGEQARGIAEQGRPAVVFAADKFIGQRALSDWGITFCQIPYELHRAGVGVV